MLDPDQTYGERGTAVAEASDLGPIAAGDPDSERYSALRDAVSAARMETACTDAE